MLGERSGMVEVDRNVVKKTWLVLDLVHSFDSFALKINLAIIRSCLSIAGNDIRPRVGGLPAY